MFWSRPTIATVLAASAIDQDGPLAHVIARRATRHALERGTERAVRFVTERWRNHGIASREVSNRSAAIPQLCAAD